MLLCSAFLWFFTSNAHFILQLHPLRLQLFSHRIYISFFLFSSSLQGTVNNQTGILPESFVKIIKPLPESDSEGEGGGHTYSCLRCFLLTPSGVETRSDINKCCQNAHSVMWFFRYPLTDAIYSYEVVNYLALGRETPTTPPGLIRCNKNQIILDSECMLIIEFICYYLC